MYIYIAGAVALSLAKYIAIYISYVYLYSWRCRPLARSISPKYIGKYYLPRKLALFT